jgi:phosphatidylserine decarboxylase
VTPEEHGIIVSPADGRIVEIVDNTASDHLAGVPLKRLSIFMSLFNVHVNRCPVSGVVEKIVYVPGRFLDARESEASRVNEHNCVVLNGEDGSIEVVQVAGLLARRIACWIRQGDRVRQGERFGLIRFGSRLDVYLPENYCLVVNVGSTVRAGESIIARKHEA